MSFSPPQTITLEDTDLQIVYADFATNKDLQLLHCSFSRYLIKFYEVFFL